MSASNLQRAAVREAAMQDAAAMAFDAQLRRVYRKVQRRITAQIDALDQDETGRLVVTSANLMAVHAMKRDVRAMLHEAGFDALAIDAMGDPLDALADAVLPEDAE